MSITDKSPPSPQKSTDVKDQFVKTDFSAPAEGLIVESGKIVFKDGSEVELPTKSFFGEISKYLND